MSQGVLCVFNRDVDTFEWRYNSSLYQLEGHCFGWFPETVASHGRQSSVVLWDPTSGKTISRLVLQGEPGFGLPCGRLTTKGLLQELKRGRIRYCWSDLLTLERVAMPSLYAVAPVVLEKYYWWLVEQMLKSKWVEDPAWKER